MAIALISCSAEDGTDGAIGPQGPAGQNGIDGVDGTNGVDGEDGADGVDGVDGADGENGNANVRTFIYDTSTLSGTNFFLSAPAITRDVLDNDVVLSYFKALNNLYYPMPGPGISGAFVTRIHQNVGSFTINFHNWDGSALSITASNIQNVKLIIIESSSTTTGKANTQQKVYDELVQAGVDVSDYYAVCDHYGIAY